MYEREVAPAALTMADAARELSVSRAQAYRLAQAGELRTVLVGRRKRVPRWAIDELLAQDRALVPSPVR